MGCYDRIIRSHTILNSRKFGILNNICKGCSIAHDMMQFKTQINNNISKTSYSSSTELIYYGAGQGAGNEGTNWTFISIPMIAVVEDVSQGCIINLPRGNTKWQKHMLAFVDHKRHNVNCLPNQSNKNILTAMRISVSSWNELLHIVGGALETSKYAWYLITWDFHSNDSPFMNSAEVELKITMHDGTKIQSTQLQPNPATTYLGVTSQVDGDQSAQIAVIKKKANNMSRKLNCCHMPHYYGHIHQLCSINPKLTYPLVASSMSNKQLKSIQSIIHPSVITSKGFNRNWPEGLRYGDHKYCGLDLIDFRVEHECERYKCFINFYSTQNIKY